MMSKQPQVKIDPNQLFIIRRPDFLLTCRRERDYAAIMIDIHGRGLTRAGMGTLHTAMADAATPYKFNKKTNRAMFRGFGVYGGVVHRVDLGKAEAISRQLAQIVQADLDAQQQRL